MRRSRERVDFWLWLLRYRRQSRPLLMTAIREHAAAANLYVLRNPAEVGEVLADLVRNEHGVDSADETTSMPATTQPISGRTDKLTSIWTVEGSTMTIAEMLLLDFDAEILSTRRLLERIPENDPQWRPHEKSMPIGRLALHTARLPNFATQILTTTELDMAKEKWPDIIFESTAHLLVEVERTSGQMRAVLAASSDDELRQHWRLLFGGRVLVDLPRMVLYRTMFLNHLVHHRAQLTVYLRLLNIPVPGLFGPSADEPFSG